MLDLTIPALAATLAPGDIVAFEFLVVHEQGDESVWSFDLTRDRVCRQGFWFRKLPRPKKSFSSSA